MNEEHLHRAIEGLTHELCRVANNLAGVTDERAILERLAQMETRIMSAISDYQAVVGPAFDAISTSVDEIVASQTGIAADVAGLKDIILKLQNSPGPISPEDQATLDAGQAKVVALQAKTSAVSEALKALDAQTETPPTPPVV